MTVNNILVNDINNVINFNGKWITDFLQLLNRISDYLCSIDSDEYDRLDANLRSQRVYGESEEEDRTEINYTIAAIRSMIARH